MGKVFKGGSAVKAKLGKYGEGLGFLDCFNEVTAAIAAAASSSTTGMSDWAYRVETTPGSPNGESKPSRLAPIAKISMLFRLSDKHRHLTVEKNKQLFVKLYPEPSTLTKEQPPIATFIIKIVSSAPNRKTLIHPGVCEKLLKNNDDFVWAIETTFIGKFIIEVEFLDLKIVPQSGEEPSSIWTGQHIEKHSLSIALNSLSRMLTDGIHSDITINASNGSIAAHRAVLATRSPVFRSMFSHDLREKELSTVNISDMSFEACRAFLNFVYGNFVVDEFLTHRLDLLRAADKYDVADLKEACHESLLEDITAKNVLERLQTAHLYRLQRLKSACLRYLVNFGKIYDVRDDFNVFLQDADRELITEIFHEVLAAWKGF
ncbi:hypothetical protein HPP92_019701 [Vanilla planifolia]|uniref:BTB domain-containing protein n=1 Tax=Vanilla planifolia TaxID=51239 RepID=A0A835Q9B1_VANPL|nr:hypothetical protein HPP92_019701 [Vanilla planifolia]